MFCSMCKDFVVVLDEDMSISLMIATRTLLCFVANILPYLSFEQLKLDSVINFWLLAAMNKNCNCRKWIVSWPLCAKTVIVESLSFKWALQVAKNFGSEELKLP